MSTIIEKLISPCYHFLSSGDSRVTHLPFMGSPIPAISILLAYLLFVFHFGPKMMKDKEPYKINGIIMKYNLIQIFFNSIGVVTGIVVWPDVKFFCTPTDYMPLVYAHYCYLLLKGLDLVDTVFFVLKKKFKHITFLHLYHHIVMYLGSWLTGKYIPGGQLFFLGFMNCFVHVVMYIYYFLTAWDPKYKNSIWWKKHITQLQILQHCFVFVSFSLPLFNPNCTYPKKLLAAYLPLNVLMIYLFTQFYINAYLKKVKK